MQFRHLNSTLGASLIASSASCLPETTRAFPLAPPRRTSGCSPPSDSQLSPGISTYLKPLRTHTFAHVTADRRYAVSHRDCPLLEVPRTRLCCRFRPEAAVCNGPLGHSVGSRLGATPERHLSLAAFYQKWPTKNTHSALRFN